MTALALVGPPWRTIPREAVQLAIDAPPAAVACEAWAAGSAELGELHRAGSQDDAHRIALRLAEDGGSEALVLKGGMRLESGRWIWPVVKARVGVAKQNPLTHSGFRALVEQRRRGLLRSVRAAERRAIQAARRDLRRDWARLVPRAARRALGRVEQQIRRIPRRQRVRRAMRVLTDRAEEVAARASGRQMTRRDRRRARRGARTQLARMEEEYTERAERFRAEADAIVQRARGDELSSREARRQLRQALSRAVRSNTDNYIDIVASAVVNRARSRGLIEAMRRQGTESYIWRALGGPNAFDPAVCDICRFMDGTVFPVQQAAQQLEASDSAVPNAPWYKVQGNTIMATNGLRRRQGGQAVTPVAEVQESAVGTSARGSFRTRTAPQQAGGTVTPPAHGRCRCRLIPNPDEQR